MTCPHCEELRERIAWLESELGVQNSQTQIRLICSAFALTKTEAWFVMTLWKAKGRTVDRFWLLDNRPLLDRTTDRENINVLRVYMSKLRKLFGPHINPQWGKGYYMTAEGIALVDAVIGAGTQGETNANRSGRRHDKGLK